MKAAGRQINAAEHRTAPRPRTVPERPHRVHLEQSLPSSVGARCSRRGPDDPGTPSARAHPGHVGTIGQHPAEDPATRQATVRRRTPAAHSGDCRCWGCGQALPTLAADLTLARVNRGRTSAVLANWTSTTATAILVGLVNDPATRSGGGAREDPTTPGRRRRARSPSRTPDWGVAGASAQRQFDTQQCRGTRHVDSVSLDEVNGNTPKPVRGVLLLPLARPSGQVPAR
jgi:hypothetical protein